MLVLWVLMELRIRKLSLLAAIIKLGAMSQTSDFLAINRLK